MWIPVAVAVGFDAVLHPNSLIVSLIVGVAGWIVSELFYLRIVSSRSASAEKWKMQFAGRSIQEGYRSLEEIEAAQIR